MKKIFLFSLLFLLVGCTSQKNEAKDDNGEERAEPPYYIILLKDFQANPSLEGFYNICKEGKDLETHITKKSLSEDKTFMEDVPITLSEAMPSCEKIDDDDFIFVTTSDTGLFAELKDSDTDEIRIGKLQFNDRIKNDIRDNQIYGYNKTSAKDITPFLENTAPTKFNSKYGGYWDFEGQLQQNVFKPIDESYSVVLDSFRGMNGGERCDPKNCFD